MTTPEDVLAYWLDEVGPSGWYAGGDDLDADIRKKFQDAWVRASKGHYGLWLTYPTGTLAYLILMDQFSRNMFRNDPRAFASDRKALAAAKIAIDRGWDKRIDAPARQFFYMPLMHSENLCDQDRAVRLFLTRMPQGDGSQLLHAQAHREIIRRFGRFPYRNAALGRTNTAAETAFIAEGGYSSQMKALREAA